MRYEYKIDSIRVEIVDSSLKDGSWSPKIAGQIETKLREYADHGFEYYRSEVIQVQVKATCCFGIPDPKNNYAVNVLTFIFRRPLQ